VAQRRAGRATGHAKALQWRPPRWAHSAPPFGHVRQLDAVAARLLVNLAAHTPLLGGIDLMCIVDIDDTP
jgi:hypothetical protein